MPNSAGRSRTTRSSVRSARIATGRRALALREEVDGPVLVLHAQLVVSLVALVPVVEPDLLLRLGGRVGVDRIEPRLGPVRERGFRAAEAPGDGLRLGSERSEQREPVLGGLAQRLACIGATPPRARVELLVGRVDGDETFPHGHANLVS